MKKILHHLLIATIVAFSSFSINANAGEESISSLRGTHGLDEVSKEAEPKRWPKDGLPIQRNYVQQPPLIPHKIDGYQINTKFNKCLSCHSWSKYRQSGATKISQTHFKGRDGIDLASVSSRRYFCTQCHVPQANATPLVGNTFTPVHSVGR